MPMPVPAGLRLERAAGHGQTCPGVETMLKYYVGHFSTKWVRFTGMAGHGPMAVMSNRQLASCSGPGAWRDTGKDDGPTGSP